MITQRKMLPHSGMRPHYDGTDSDVLCVQLCTEPLPQNLQEAKDQNISILSYPQTSSIIR